MRCVSIRECFLVFFCMLIGFAKSEHDDMISSAPAADVPDPFVLHAVDETVWSKGLIQTKAHTADNIISNFFYFSSDRTKKFSQDTLGYVTPWNNHGYDIAKYFARKYTYISPVWLQLKLVSGDSSSKLKIEIGGTQDIDQGWMEDIRKNSDRKTKIVPRVLFENFSPSLWKILAKNSKLQKGVIQRLIDLLQRSHFDGFVLECTEAWPSLDHVDKSLRSSFNQFLISFANVLHALKPMAGSLILVVGPSDRQHAKFSSTDFNQVAQFIDKFSLMTYDYASHSGKAGPNAPLPWMESVFQQLFGSDDHHIVDPQLAKKILIGLNFYGMDFSARESRAILGHDYIKLLRLYSPKLLWDAEAREHYFRYIDSEHAEHLVYYPSLLSIHDRLKLIDKLQAGASIWDIGQGLDYWQDLL
eukprot:TRINITY_DN1593_c0_g1_i1.p1 TRINITY_DN1593_c0_g1~~TRINITY_DN1593_c0_g1_i1.p1  ORF type:complete len:415 (-),score=70.99 TRINITY_DN1593_c0_g1_i1:265-1509(-)